MRFLKVDYIQNVATLMVGTSFAQIIPILASPLLTRLYSPEIFGGLGVYLALVAVLVVCSAGRYENAIMLSKDSSDARDLLVLSITLACLFSVVVAFFVGLANIEIANVLGMEEFSFWLYLLPLSIFIVSSYSSLTYWLNRHNKFRKMATNRVVQNGSITGIQIGWGLATASSIGLLLGEVLGRVITILTVLVTFFREEKWRFNFGNKLYLLKRYKKFPIHGVPAALFNVSAFQLPLILIPMFFSSVVAGFYFLVFRVIMMPISLVGDAVLEVFRSKATIEFNESGDCRSLFLKTMYTLVLIGVVPMAILMLWGAELFEFVFGDEWGAAGVYAGILAPMAMLRLVSLPLSYMFFIREKLSWNMFLQGIFLLLTAVSVVVGGYCDDIKLMVFLLSITGSAFYVVQVFLSFKLTKADGF